MSILNLRIENRSRLNACYKKHYDTEFKGLKHSDLSKLSGIRPKALATGLTIGNTCTGAIAIGLKGLNEEFINGSITDNVKLTSNSKLGEIIGINFPNIYVQTSFMQLVKLNPELRELPVVGVLMDYFETHSVCHNCSKCSGICYNNKFEYGKLGKSIGELRTLVAYITDRKGLESKILKQVRFLNLFRINNNGEIHSKEMLEFWLGIAKKRPDTRFYTYTKSYEIFEEYLEKNKLPKNFRLNMSFVGSLEDDDNKKLIKKFPLLSQKNKFVIVPEIPEKTTHKVCCGDCTECAGYCWNNLKADNNIILCKYHN